MRTQRRRRRGQIGAGAVSEELRRKRRRIGIGLQAELPGRGIEVGRQAGSGGAPGPVRRLGGLGRAVWACRSVATAIGLSMRRLRLRLGGVGRRAGLRTAAGGCGAAWAWRRAGRACGLGGWRGGAVAGTTAATGGLTGISGRMSRLALAIGGLVGGSAAQREAGLRRDRRRPQGPCGAAGHGADHGRLVGRHGGRRRGCRCWRRSGGARRAAAAA